MGYFTEIYAKELPHRAKAVYMYLKDRSNQEGQCDLVRAGLVTKEQRWRENGGRSSLLFTLKGRA